MTKDLENQLLKQKKFFESILSGMEDWVRVVDFNNRVIFMNEPMKKKVGNKEGKQCYLSLGKNSPSENCITNRSIIQDKAIRKEEVVGDRIYSVVSSPIKDENNVVNCAVEVFRDVTEAKAMQALILEQNKKMKNDLNFAKQLQHKILPESKIYHDTLKIESQYIPCEILGGDVYDVIEIDEENIGLYIADVSGHGVTSSMMTMFIRQTLKNIGRDAINPEVTLRYLYGRYREINIDDQHYITIFYGVYNIKDRLFTYSNAGHNCMPIVISRTEVVELELPGLPICTLFNDVKYDTKSISLKKGDKILLYTDGITEVQNSKYGFYSSENVLKLCRENKEIETKELLKLLIQEVEAFAEGAIKDDIALMFAEII